MNTMFQVPIRGNFVTLLVLALPFFLTTLRMGLWISNRATTRDASMQMSIGTVIPSIFLSGYVFPLDSMPAFFWNVAKLVATTWIIDASRDVILRGADWVELRPHAAVLTGMAFVALVTSSVTFRKRVV
jgi:ABC-2 type transport system permease protein